MDGVRYVVDVIGSVNLDDGIGRSGISCCGILRCRSGESLGRVDEVKIERSVRSDRVVIKISLVGDDVGIGEIVRNEDYWVRNVVVDVGDGDGLIDCIGECSVIESLSFWLKVGVVYYEKVGWVSGGFWYIKEENVIGSLGKSGSVVVDRKVGVWNSFLFEGIVWGGICYVI